MVEHLVYEVRSEQQSAQISYETAVIEAPKKKDTKKTNSLTDEKCPKCKEGTILKGNTAFGCSQFKQGCTLKIPFEFMGKKLSENQVKRLVSKGSTVNLKGFKTETGKKDGAIHFNEQFELILVEKESQKQEVPDPMPCPKCKKGKIMKGKTAFGCSEFKNGCDYLFSFQNVRTKAQGKEMTKELVYQILIS